MKMKRGSWGRNARVEREDGDTEKDTVEEDEEEVEKEQKKVRTKKGTHWFMSCRCSQLCSHVLLILRFFLSFPLKILLLRKLPIGDPGQGLFDFKPADVAWSFLYSVDLPMCNGNFISLQAEECTPRPSSSVPSMEAISISQQDAWCDVDIFCCSWGGWSRCCSTTSTGTLAERPL
jgi:hypothetical protein